MHTWSRSETLTIASLLVAVIGCLATVMVPEAREFLGLPPQAHQPAGQPPDQQASPPATAEPAPDQSAAVPITGAVAEDAWGTQRDAGQTLSPAQERIPDTEEARQEQATRLSAERDSRTAMNALRRSRGYEQRAALGQTLSPAQERIPDTEEARQQQAARLRAERNLDALRRLSGDGQRAATKGLVIFKVKPADASVYLDDKYIGTPEEWAAGIWIQKGDHSLTIVSPGMKPHESTLTVIAGDSLDVEVELKRGDDDAVPRRPFKQ